MVPEVWLLGRTRRPTRNPRSADGTTACPSGRRSKLRRTCCDKSLVEEVDYSNANAVEQIGEVGLRVNKAYSAEISASHFRVLHDFEISGSDRETNSLSTRRGDAPSVAIRITTQMVELTELGGWQRGVWTGAVPATGHPQVEVIKRTSGRA
jgi:hypothetical protein